MQPTATTAMPLPLSLAREVRRRWHSPQRQPRGRARAVSRANRDHCMKATFCRTHSAKPVLERQIDADGLGRFRSAAAVVRPPRPPPRDHAGEYSQALCVHRGLEPVHRVLRPVAAPYRRQSVYRHCLHSPKTAPKMAKQHGPAGGATFAEILFIMGQPLPGWWQPNKLGGESF
jgi:hypothetical protein